MTVLLLRHGETALNRAGALRGLIDVPLSTDGIQEAAQMAQRVAAEYRLTGVYTSPLLRARETAKAVARAAAVPVVVDDRFVDMDYGEWAGRTFDTLSPSERDEFRRWQRDPTVPLPGAEDPAEAQRRALAGLTYCVAQNHGCIAIVSHDAVLQLLLCRILRLDLRGYRGLSQHTATLNELEHTNHGWRARLLNSTWHLDATP